MMRVAFALMMTAALVAVTGCDEPASKAPTGPEAPAVSGVELSGPSTLAPGQSAQYTVTVVMADGTRKVPAPSASLVWQTGIRLRVTPAGVVTADSQTGESSVNVAVSLPGGTKSSSMSIVVVPEGTYRVVGTVRDAESPSISIAGARVEVTPGGLSLTANSFGQYRLYGVPPEAEITVTAAGYQTLQQRLSLNSHVTQNFDMRVSSPRPNFAGNYTLAITATGTCAGPQPLSSDLRHREYDAVLTQSGAIATVTLTEPRFRLNGLARGNKFTGQVDATGVRFTLDSFSYYTYFSFSQLIYPNLAERLPNGTILVIDGFVNATGSASGLSGSMAGSFALYNQSFPIEQTALGWCSSPIQLSLTPR